MTPSMGMAAPKGMATAPQAGLAAIAQPATAPKGISSGNMAQVMALARKMSDGQLAEVLQGKSLDVPQYVAMTEAMGRKQLRTAMSGQQAMAQAQQPSVKEKLLMGDQPQMPQGMPQQPMMAAQGGLMYSDGGIADLPAPNMDSMDMASGGIVAFDEGGEVPRFNGEYSSLVNPLQYVSMPTDPNYVPSKEESESQKLRRIIAENQAEEEKRNAGIKDFIFTPSQRTRAARKDDVATTAKTAAMTPDQLTALATNKGVFPEGSPALPGTGAAAAPDVTMPARKAVGTALNAPGPDKTKAGIGGTDEFASYMDMVKKNRDGFLSKLEGMGAKQREGLAQLKSQGGGEALLNIASALFSNPNMAMAAGQGASAVAKTAAASRKEQRAVEQSANEMDFNLAKAQEAASRGDMESALMFKRLHDEAAYRKQDLSLRAATLNQEPEALRTLKGIAGNPQLEALYGKTGKTNQMSLTDAAKQWNDMPKDNRKYYKELQSMGINSEQDYYRYVNGSLLSATIPGQGAQTRPY